MATMEHLFMQIFERRAWIEEQLRQQAESCAQSLASNLLAHGRRPPSWLWAPPGEQDVNREELISGILFPFPRVTTPSMKQSSLFTMPASKADVFPSNNYFTGVCTSDKYFSMKDRVQPGPSNYPKASEQRSDTMFQGEAVEVHAEFDSLARIQRSRSRQRDLEIRQRKKAKTIEDSSEDKTVGGFTGRVTRSMTSSLKPDCAKELLELKIGRVTQSRSKAQKPDCVDKPSVQAEMMACIGNGIQQEVKSQTFADGANVHVSDAASLKCLERSKRNVASRLSAEADFFVQPKELFRDGTECSLNETSVVVQASNEASTWRCSNEAPQSLWSIDVQEGDGLHTVETRYCTEEADKIRDETCVVEDSECSSDPSSLNHRSTPLECNSHPAAFLDKPSNLCNQSSWKVNHRVSETGLTCTSPVIYMLNQERSLGSSMRNFREGRCSEKHFEASTSSMVSRPPNNDFIADPEHPSEENIIAGVTGRVTRSMTSSSKPDCVEVLVELKNGKASQLRYEAQKPDCVDKPSVQAEMMACIGNGIQEEVKSQTFADGAIVHVSDVASPKCHEHSKRSAVASRLSEINVFSQPKQLFNNDIVCSLNETSVIVNASNESSTCRCSMEEPHSVWRIDVQEGDALHTVETMYFSEEDDKIQGKIEDETRVVEDSECSSDPSSLNHRFTPLECNSHPAAFLDKPSNLCNQLSRKANHRVSETVHTSTSPVISLLNQERSLGSSMLNVREERCSEKHFKALNSSMASMPPKNDIIADPEHPSVDSKRCDDSNSTSAFLKESHGSHPGVSSKKCKTSQSVNEGTLCKEASRTSASKHLQNDSTLHITGALHGVEEVERVPGGLVDESLQVFEVAEAECSRSISYKGHGTYVLVVNGQSSLGGQVQHAQDAICSEELVKVSRNVATLLEEGSCPQSKVVVAMLEAAQLVKEDSICKESEMTHVSSSNGKEVMITLGKLSSGLSDTQEKEIPLFLVTEIPHMPAILSRNDWASEPVTQVQVAELGLRHMPESFDLKDQYKSIGSYSTVLPSSVTGKAHVESKEDICCGSYSDTKDKCVNGELPNKEAVEARYLLRSSASLDRKLCHQHNASALSCSNEGCSLLDDHRNDIIIGTRNVAEMGVVHQEVTPYAVETQNALRGSRYFLRSSARHLSDSASFNSLRNNGARKLELSKEPADHLCEITWPKRRKIEGQSKNILATTCRLKRKNLLHVQQGNSYTCKRSKENASKTKELQPSPLSNQVAIRISSAPLEEHLEEMHQSKKRRTTEGDSYLKGKDLTPMIPMPTKRTHQVAFPDQQCGESENYLQNEMGAIDSNHFCSEEKLDQLCDGNPLECESHKRQGSNEGVTPERVIYDRAESLGRHDSVQLLEHDDNPAACNDIMPEFEGFSIGFPPILEDGIIFNYSDISNCTKERASLLEQLCRSRGMLSPVSHSSMKYKIHDVPDVYQSLPAGLLEHISAGGSFQLNDVEMKQNLVEDVNFDGLKSKFESDFGGSLLERLHSHSMPCSSFKSTCEVKSPPLTPQVGKLTQRISSRKSTSSEKVGSKPELICFRIDENSVTTDEEECEAISENKVGRMKVKVSTVRKPLVDVTSLNQNAPASASEPEKFLERSSLNSVNAESYSQTLIDFNSGTQNEYDNKGRCKPDGKENQSFSTSGNRRRKAADSLSSWSSKPEVSRKGRNRNGSQTFLGEGGKPSNIVSNIASFIPLVRQKQQATAPLAGKRDIKVKALEAAEAAKRLQEKKQNERELRRAAVKLERKRLDEENARQLELKQKQQEAIKRKKDADTAARKRQREEEERKEKERKRRCIEEARKQQRVYGERSRVEKETKEPHHKAADNKEQRRNDFQEDGERQLKSEKGREVVDPKKVAEVKLGDGRLGGSTLEARDVYKQSNDIKKVEKNSANLQNTIQDRMSFTKGCKDMESYEISPYKDSDDEDAEEDSKRKRKYIPQWARRDSLDQLLISVRHVDPSVIFSHKSSFNLSEVLSHRILRRPV